MSNGKKKSSVTVHTANPSASLPTPAVEFTQETHIGPLPTPEDFARYEAVLPGAAREILDMAKKEAAHRHQIETKAVSQNDDVIKLEGKKLGTVKLGQVIGGIVSVGVLCLAGLAIIHDQGLAAVGLILTNMGALVLAFRADKKSPPMTSTEVVEKKEE